MFGGGTYSAVVQFQRDNGLANDGIVGRNTWSKLLGI
ncbi:peptidoglycan-binding protein [Clostridium sp. HBUAS56017]|nr:peptidoglycan-binding protein [Clostridium sp. HBUAS56017]